MAAGIYFSLFAVRGKIYIMHTASGQVPAVGITPPAQAPLEFYAPFADVSKCFKSVLKYPKVML